MADTLLIEKADGTQVVVGADPSRRQQLAAEPFSPGRLAASELPPYVNLAPRLTPVEDQGDSLSCVANAAAGAYEYLVKRHLGTEYDTSRLFIYYNARKQDGDENEDGGTSIENAIAGLIAHGACAERSWPFALAHVNDPPSSAAYDEAQRFKVEYTEQVPTELDAWRHCLAEGHPILFMARLYRSFKDCRGGRMTWPLPDELERGRRYNHAMLCVGYSDKDRAFIVRNSWGPRWGHKGHCYIPYDYLMSDDYNVDDSWIIRRIVDIDEVDRSVWGEAQSAVPALDRELDAMPDEAFGALLLALGEVPLASRLALLYLAAARADQAVSEPELVALAAELAQVTERLGYIGFELDPAAVLRSALRYAEEPTRFAQLVDETVVLLGRHLSRRTRAAILVSIRRIAGADTLSPGEQGFVDALISGWGIEHDEADAGDTDPSLAPVPLPMNESEGEAGAASVPSHAR